MHPETPRTPMQKAVNSLTTYLAATLGAVRTPQWRIGGSINQESDGHSIIPGEAMPGALTLSQSRS